MNREWTSRRNILLSGKKTYAMYFETQEHWSKLIQNFFVEFLPPDC